MAISRDTFDPRKRYELVQFQQRAVAVSDFELNELQQILHHKVEEFISTIIDGLDAGKFIADGFKVVPSADNVNNFTVSPGVLLFRGKLIRLYDPIEYKTQTGVPPLTTPVGGRTDTVYVQITFNKEVTAADDPDIVDPLIQEETARRTKIDLKFLVNEGVSGVPADNPSAGIYNIPLARINRTGPEITSVSIVDLRKIFYGFASLDADGKVPSSQLPPMNYVGSGSSDTDVAFYRSVLMPIHNRSTVNEYDTQGRLYRIYEKSGSTTVRTTTLNYDEATGRLASITFTAGGIPKTITFNYDPNSGQFLGTTRS